MCNEIERLTFEKRIEFRGFDWSKEVGNDAIGANFGAKAVNYAEMSLCKFNSFILVLEIYYVTHRSNGWKLLASQVQMPSLFLINRLLSKCHADSSDRAQKMLFWMIIIFLL